MYSVEQSSPPTARTHFTLQTFGANPILSVSMNLTTQGTSWGFPVVKNGKESFTNGSVVKNPTAKAGDTGMIPSWDQTPVFLPGECHGQRSLAGYSPWGCKELNSTAQLSMHTAQACKCVKLNSIRLVTGLIH